MTCVEGLRADTKQSGVESAVHPRVQSTPSDQSIPDLGPGARSLGIDWKPWRADTFMLSPRAFPHLVSVI